MGPRSLVLIQRLAWLTAALASAALVVDYQNIGDPTFCGVDSPCFKVRASEVGRLLAGLTHKLGMTVPHFGILAHLGLLALAIAARTAKLVRGVAVLATLGALAAVGLLVSQAMLGELCPWCGLVDVASIVGAVASIQLARLTKDDEAAAWARDASTMGPVLAWSSAAAGMVALPFVWAQNPETVKLPPQIEGLQTEGKLTIISFTDFECPFCRKLAPVLDDLKQRDGVAFKRMMAPLPMHVGASAAALAYQCVAPDKQDEMARHLYAAPTSALDRTELRRAVERLELGDGEAFATCFDSPETKARVDAEKQLFQDAGGTGLPTTWVGRRMVKGFQPQMVLRAFESERRGGSFALPVWTMFVAAAAIGGAAARLSWTSATRAARRSASAPAHASSKSARTDPGDSAPRVASKPKPSARKPAQTLRETPAAKRHPADVDEADVVGSRDSEEDEKS